MSDDVEKPEPLKEPSVLDYVKSLFRFGNGKSIQIPIEQTLSPEQVEKKQSLFDTAPQLQPLDHVQREPAFVEAPSVDLQLAPEPVEAGPVPPFPWRSLLAFLLAWTAQRTFEPPHTSAEIGFAIYIAAFSLLGWAVYRGEWKLPGHAPAFTRTDPLTYRGLPLILGIGLAIVAFFLLGGNLFTKLNVTIWVLAILLLLGAFWLNKDNLRSGFDNLASWFPREGWMIRVSWWTLLLVAATALIFFFRFHQTATVPPEPFSDHAEKLLDVYDVSQGLTHIFFIRNTGREAFQMYWTLLIAKLFGTGLSFLSLKLGTAILGFLTLPFIYLLGKEIGGRRVGFIAFLMVGIGYWPNVISRVGLRFPLYPLFAAPTLLFLLRGLRTRNRNDFLLSGLLPWLFFSIAVLQGLTSILTNQELIRKVRLPQAVFPLSVVGSNLVNFALSFVPLFLQSVTGPLPYGTVRVQDVGQDTHSVAAASGEVSQPWWWDTATGGGLRWRRVPTRPASRASPGLRGPLGGHESPLF